MAKRRRVLGRAVRWAGVWLGVGVVVSLGLAWAAALAVRVPQYPRLHSRECVIDGEAWHAVTSYGVAAREQWWGAADPEDLAGRTPEAYVADQVAQQNGRVVDGKKRVVVVGRPWWGTLAGDGYPESKFGSDVGFGWPLPAMWMQVVGVVQGNTITSDELRGGIFVSGALSSRDHAYRALPLRIVWIGLVADVVFWALVLGGGRALFVAARARRRGARGRCPSCGYDLGGELRGGCPECAWGKSAE